MYKDRPLPSLRKFVGKQLLAFLRQGDFAHAGEIEAIELAMAPFTKKPDQYILDVGCGLGGTAAYLYEQGWGKVTGVDIETEAIHYAQQKYPEIAFYISDVAHADKVITEKFDILCLFNSFYAFPDPLAALQVMQRLTKPQGQMVIFDYADPCINGVSPLFRAGSEHITPFMPIRLDTIDTLLEKAAWKKTRQMDLTAHYFIWYHQLINKLLTHKQAIIAQFHEAAFAKAWETYTQIKDGLASGTLGGVLIYAKKAS